jgi:glycosyltransferase involved in cell wall biosynthesis
MTAPPLAGTRIALLGDASVVHTWRWGEGLAERGARVRLFSLEQPLAPAANGEVEFEAVPGWPLPRALRYPAALPPLKRAVDAFGPDLVDAHFLPNYGLLAALLGSRPWVANSWGSDLLLARGGWRRARVRFVLRRADLIYTDAEVSKRKALALGADADRVVLQPWGVDTVRFPFGADAAARRRRRLHWPQEWGGSVDSTCLGVSTRFLHPLYDVATALLGWSQFASEKDDATLIVVGDGPEAQVLRNRAAELELGERVRFLGRLQADAIAGILRDADYYLSTSHSDTTSISLLEAMSAGAFPIVTDLPANREWVGEETAEIFPPGNGAALAAALRRAQSRGAGIETARQSSRQRVEEEASRESAMSAVAERYRELLRRPL